MSTNTVSIFMLTYNQEHFIAQTIESVLMQKTNFNYQLVIGEDFSTDETRRICENYAVQYPQKIKLLPALVKNIGLTANYMRTIQECDGKYIAICDGDDYWIDEFKLQKQVTYLEKNPHCDLVHTNLRLLKDSGEFVSVIREKSKLEFKTFEDMLQDNKIYSLTVMFRNFQDKSKLPQWVLKYPYGDLPTYLWILKEGGGVHLLEDITAVYRLGIGVSSKLENHVNIVQNILNDAYNDQNFSLKKRSLEKYFYDQECFKIVIYHRKGHFFKALKQTIILLIKNPLHWKLLKVYLSSLKKKMYK